jgi:outer membrane protein insertion porin family
MHRLAAGILATLFLQTAPIIPRTAPETSTPARTPIVIPVYRLGEIKVNGARAIPSEVVRQSVGVSGEVFDQSRLSAALEDLKDFYGEGGYVKFAAHTVLESDEQQKVVNLTVNVDEGRRYVFNRISFTGNTTILDEVIRREIPLTEGFAMNTRLLESGRVRLNQLGLFEEIKKEDIQIIPSPDELKVDVVVRVKERQR